MRVIIRTKYVNSQTGEILLAPMPEEALPKCEADETLLAYSKISKFVDHLPEHRIQQMLKARTGGNTTVYDEYVDTENG